MRDNLNTVLQQEMSRREFLTTLGLGVASVAGIGGILRLLGHRGFELPGNSGRGYGSSPYGK